MPPDRLSGSTREQSTRMRARVVATLVGSGLVAVGALAVGVAIAGQDPGSPGTPEQSERSAGSGKGLAGGSSSREEQVPSEQAPDGQHSPDGGKLPELGWSKPVAVAIPRIDVRSSLEDLGLDSAGVMTTPQDHERAGWFTPAPPPGLIGVAVIAGHVTWDGERSVFFDLDALRPGDRVEVEREDGVTAVFEVTRLGRFPKEQFPTEAVYRPVGNASLRLITCGGGYDEVANRYLDNVIVWADMVDVERS
ncbi:MAG: class F sortase [Actinomycetota bacterium]|nr:class F sortase [Actinomycetota bacterium]